MPDNPEIRKGFPTLKTRTMSPSKNWLIRIKRSRLRLLKVPKTQEITQNAPRTRMKNMDVPMMFRPGGEMMKLRKCETAEVSCTTGPALTNAR